MKRENDITWDLEDEKKFIDNLGTYKDYGDPNLSYAELLARYIAGTEKRKPNGWKRKALEYARKKLRQA